MRNSAREARAEKQDGRKTQRGTGARADSQARDRREES